MHGLIEAFIYTLAHTHTHTHTHTHIYIYREREREREMYIGDFSPLFIWISYTVTFLLT